ncbi:hypothetical protein [Azorhizobium caulinodans]|uniref:hypothetical protein n=1 Tax=Azorhizobium caulinodans TaxID=7 RepID=UPI0011D0FFF4|nr:hypothetical protein [Azorhizobium caulinodans]
MSDGMWGSITPILGAIVGAAGSIAALWVGDHLKRKAEFPEFDDNVKKLLLEELERDSDWRSITELSNIIGCTKKETREYLIEIGARGSRKNPENWALKSKKPLSDSD